MIDRLEFLLALSRERHFGRAAEACGVSQPSFSAGIKGLEESLGVMLVHRGSRFLGFTAEGERALDWGRRIVADSRAMREELKALKQGLRGHLRIAVIPTALAVMPGLTTPFRERNPEVRFTIRSATSDAVLQLIDDLEVEAGVTYLDNEPFGRLAAVPLYQEAYHLLTAPDAELGGRDSVTWAEVARLPLCLLTPDMQNRRIVDALLQQAGGGVEPVLESNSVSVLYAHVRTARWASVMPDRMAVSLGLTDRVRSIPIVEPRASHGIGLVAPRREPMMPLTAALVAEAGRFARRLEQATIGNPDRPTEQPY